jgi:hypothetical protein
MSELVAKLRPQKPGRLFAAISAGRRGGREIPLCAARPFAGAKGEKKSGCSVRNDGRGGSGKGEERRGVPCPYGAGGRAGLKPGGYISEPAGCRRYQLRITAHKTSWCSGHVGAEAPTPKRSEVAVALRGTTRSVGLVLARCVRLFARGCRLPAWSPGTSMARR